MNFCKFTLKHYFLSIIQKKQENVKKFFEATDSQNSIPAKRLKRVLFVKINLCKMRDGLVREN